MFTRDKYIIWYVCFPVWTDPPTVVPWALIYIFRQIFSNFLFLNVQIATFEEDWLASFISLLCYISLSSGLWNTMIETNTPWAITNIGHISANYMQSLIKVLSLSSESSSESDSQESQCGKRKYQGEYVLHMGITPHHHHHHHHPFTVLEIDHLIY